MFESQWLLSDPFVYEAQEWETTEIESLPRKSTLVADMEDRVVGGLTSGLDTLPDGSPRVRECIIRRKEIREAMGQIEQTLSEADRKLTRLGRKLTISNSSELLLLSERVECAVGMALGLERGENEIEAIASSPEHEILLQNIRECEEKSMEAQGLLETHRRNSKTAETEDAGKTEVAPSWRDVQLYGAAADDFGMLLKSLYCT